MVEIKSIDLNDLIPGTQNFTWREALWLPRWKICVYPDQIVLQNIIKFANQVMQPVRNKVNQPIRVHVWYRTAEYNQIIGGAPGSWHMTGAACDFSVTGMKTSEAKKLVEPYLGVWNARMEKDTTDWIHLDGKPRKPGEPTVF